MILENREELIKLLSAFNKEVEKRKRNFFEVAGYPHYENVVSNILKFFFDTKEEHGMKDLWLKSLLECYYVKTKGEIDTQEYVTEDVQREYATDNNKRIDLLITTEDNKAIVIENKVYATPYNPFDDYIHKVEKEYNGYQQIDILLTIHNEPKTQGCNFEKITYEQLLKRVRGNTGAYLAEANEKWLVFMNEFMKNVDSLQEESMAVDKDLQKIIKENERQVRNLLDAMKADVDAKYDFLQSACDKIKERKNDISELQDVVIGTYGKKNLSEGYCSLYVDVTIDNKHTLVYEAYFSKYPQESDDMHFGILYMSIWDRKSRNLDYATIRDIFDKYDVQKMQGRGWGIWALLEKRAFEDMSEDKFIDDSIDIIKKLVHQREHI